MVDLISKLKRVFLFCCFLFVVTLVINPNIAEAKRPANVEKYINENKAAAIEVGKKYGIFPSQILAQGGFESTWGTSSVARNNNNFYGIKGSGAYRKYASARDCMEDFAINFYVTKLNSYEQIIKAKSPYGIGKLLYIDYAPPGDGTNSEYLTSYESIVANYDVVQYDKIAFPDGIKRHPKIEEVRAGKKDNFTYEEAGQIDYSGKDVVVTDTDIKVDGTTEQKVETPNPNGGAPTENVVVTPNFTFSEKDIKGMPKERNWEEDKVEIKDGKDFQAVEKESINKWKDESNTALSETMINIFRVSIQVIGVIIVIYSLFFLIAYVFDRTTITEWKAIPVLTKNRLFAVEYKEESTFHKRQTDQPKGIATSDVIKIEALLILTAICILNGWVYAIISQIIRYANAIQSYMSSLF
ncbi:N-acetylmuramoyl-L-alanine amidase [Bacillus toyonensis]|uniref:glucosaminidase domain-containing protein n=1 Tax=Bacillus toyonensis TaxID=155322 RepID=UPI000BFDBCCA|nr:glucosaminidase domain-containing protein [Bacillus toyonensis]PHE64111.1 N-acetylmuramoyl-L-alanine amidase [Bacillus toyonensis]